MDCLNISKIQSTQCSGKKSLILRQTVQLSLVNNALEKLSAYRKNPHLYSTENFPVRMHIYKIQNHHNLITFFGYQRERGSGSLYHVSSYVF